MQILPFIFMAWWCCVSIIFKWGDKGENDNKDYKDDHGAKYIQNDFTIAGSLKNKPLHLETGEALLCPSTAGLKSV